MLDNLLEMLNDQKSGNITSKSLADLLPQLIDKLTPDGSVPHAEMLSQGIDIQTGKHR